MYKLGKRGSLSTKFANLGECESGLYSSPIVPATWEEPTNSYECTCVWGRAGGEKGEGEEQSAGRGTRKDERRGEICQYWAFIPNSKVLISETFLLIMWTHTHTPPLQYTIQTWKTMNSLIFVNLVWIKEILIHHIHIGYVESTGLWFFFNFLFAYLLNCCFFTCSVQFGNAALVFP